MDTFFVVSLIVVLAYTAFALYVGLGKAYDRKAVSSARGFFIGNGTGFFVLFMTTVASFFSTWIFTGAPGMFFRNGVSWVVSMTWQVIPVLFIGLMGPKYFRLGKTYNYLSPAEMLGHYYKSPKLQTSYGFFGVIFAVPLLLAQTSGCGLALYALFGGKFPMWACTAYCALFVGIYVYFGGFKSQAWIDTLQGLLFTIILWVSVILLVYNKTVGGFRNMWQMAENLNDNCLYYVTKLHNATGGWTWKMYLSFYISQGVGCFFTPYIAHRMYAAKNSHIPRKMAGLLAPYYCFLFMTTAVIFGVLGHVYGVQVANADNILVTLTKTYAPLWSIVVVIGVLAAGMSTISSILVSATAMISVDFVKRVNPNLSDQGLRNVGRYSIIVVVLLAVASGFVTIPGVAQLANMSANGFLVASLPVLGMFFWKRSTPAAAFWGFTIGEIITGYFMIRGINPFGFTGGMIGFLVEIILFVAISLCTKPLDEGYRKQYFSCLERTKDKDCV